MAIGLGIDTINHQQARLMLGEEVVEVAGRFSRGWFDGIGIRRIDDITGALYLTGGEVIDRAQAIGPGRITLGVYQAGWVPATGGA